MWQGFGVNYKSGQANWASDIAYFRSIGLTSIRPSLSNFPVGTYNPGSEAGVTGSIDFWRNCAKTFVDAGFWVTHGPAGMPVAAGSFTSTTWTAYRANVLLDAAYCQALGIAIDCYEIGNEIEGKIDGTTLTQAQLVANLKQLATDVKAVYPLAKSIGYGCFDAGGTFFDLWISSGLGDISLLGIHIYGQVGSTGRFAILGDHVLLGKMIRSLGASRCIITEFGIDANASQYNLAPQYNRHYCMRHLYAAIRELGYARALVYSYVGLLNADNDFALKNTNGTFDVQWNIFLNDSKRQTLYTAGGVASSITNGRSVAAERSQASGRSEATPPTIPSWFNAKGNLTPNTVTPIDKTPLRIGLTSDFSLAVYCKPMAKTATGNSSNHTFARMEFSFGNNFGYLAQAHGSNGSFRFWSGNTAYDSTTGLITYGVAQWIVFTLTGTTLKVYINGVVVWTQTIVRKLGENNASIWFLQESAGATSSTNGILGPVYEAMSALRLFSDAEIAALVTGTYPTTDIRYKFTRGAGRWVADLSGNNNHGFLGVESWGVAARAQV